MPNEIPLLSSKVVIREASKKIPNVAGLPAHRGALIGVAQKGPIGEATVVSSKEEFRKIFGDKTADTLDLGAAVDGAFDNGASELVIVRTVHYTDVSDESTATSAAATLNLETAASAPTAGSVTGTEEAPFDLEPGDTLVVDIDGASPATATFSATAAARESAAAPFGLANNDTLLVSIDGGSAQTITFLTSEFADIANATAAEVAAVINAKITGARATVTSSGTKVTITSDKRGTGSGVNVSGGTANAELGFTTGNTAGSGNVADIDAVTFAEVKTVVEAAVSGVTVTDAGSGAVKISRNTTGTTSEVQVQASSTADDELGFDNAVHTGTSGAAVDTLQIDAKYDGTFGNEIEIKISAASSGDADEFNLTVIQSDIIVEVWPNLSMSSDDDNYVETVINDPNTGSSYITVTDLEAEVDSPDNLPDIGTFGPLSGGSDGLSSLADTDFLGDSTAKTGMHALDNVQNIRFLAIPGRASSAIHNGMINYCENDRRLATWAILDPPANQTASQMKTYVTTTAAIYNLSEHAGLYWPRVKVVNPSKAIFGNVDLVTVPPSGHVMGACARQSLSSRSGGVYQAAAGIVEGRLVGVLGLESNEVLDESKRDLIYPVRINPIRSDEGAFLPYIDGSRTLKGNGNFPSVGERLGAIHIEQSIKAAVEFARHKNNTPALRAEVERVCVQFLLGEMRAGAFASDDPDLAFFVDVSDALNPPSEQRANRLNIRIGLALAAPAEFIPLEFTQDTRALDAELSA